MDNNNMMNNGNGDFNQQQFDQTGQQQPYEQQFNQQPYPQNNIYAQPGENRSKTKEILALVFGILAILISCCCTYLGIGLGIVGIIMAVLSKNDNCGKMPGMALAGIICSGLAIAISVVSIILILTGVVTVDFSSYLNNM